jgi:acetyl esterase/lipase
MVLGDAAQDSRFCRRIADQLDSVVASVEYRLAPEHPFPTPLEDCYTALQWLARQPDIDPARIAVGGESAGAGLAAAIALLAKERGEIHPLLQLLSYPMLDDRTATRTAIDPRRLRVWSQKSNRLGWRAYLGPATADGGVSPLARRPATTTSPACRPHGSASAPTTCSMTRTSHTPGDYSRPASPAPCT